MDKKKIIYVIVAVAVIIIVAIVVTINTSKDSTVATDADEQTTIKKNDSTTVADKDKDNVVKNNVVSDEVALPFGTAKKNAHYESNSPAHEEILAAPPINVVIDFNFDLAPPSSISIMQDGQEYGQSETLIDNNELSMRRDFDPAAPDGVYTVIYRACWPDESCHDGQFEFGIDRSQVSAYENMPGQEAVTIHLSEIMFAPKNITVSAGTKVTWVNDDTLEHYINTDSHPAHTYYTEQNSRSLAKGDSYSVTFDQPGAYPYHCSAHADTMVGNIVVI